ncbi:hypothetical protein ACHAXT_012784 [Thalassiosira profunda]
MGARRRRRPMVLPLLLVIDRAAAMVAPVRPDATPINYWEEHALRRNYERAGGILYKQSALSPDEFASVADEWQSMEAGLRDETESSFASRRRGARIAESSRMYDLLGGREGSLCRLVNCLEGEGDGLGNMILAREVPIEVRVYERAGAGMEWHIDDVLYEPPQVEVILTLDNTSDCNTMWRQHDMPLLSNGKELQSPTKSKGAGPKYDVLSVQTTPNSALILKAGGVEHKVTPLTSGTRTILKMAFVREGAAMLEGMEGHASHHSGNTKSQRGKKEKGSATGRRRKKR